MATYKIPNFLDEITDPQITKHGHVGYVYDKGEVVGFSAGVYLIGKGSDSKKGIEIFSTELPESLDNVDQWIKAEIDKQFKIK